MWFEALEQTRWTVLLSSEGIKQERLFKIVLDLEPPEKSLAQGILIVFQLRSWRSLSGALCTEPQNCNKAKYCREDASRCFLPICC